MNIVLIGPHGAGKTTTGHLLAAALGVPFHRELGQELAADPRWRPAGVTAQAPMEAFDRELLCREVERDHQHHGVRVIETWHPGNLAYLARRSPSLLHQALQQAHRESQRQPAVAVPLQATRHTLAARQHEPGDLDFFLSVGQEAAGWARLLGLRVLPTVWTDSSSPQQICAQICARLSALLPALRQ